MGSITIPEAAGLTAGAPPPAAAAAALSKAKATQLPLNLHYGPPPLKKLRSSGPIDAGQGLIRPKRSVNYGTTTLSQAASHHHAVSSPLNFSGRAAAVAAATRDPGPATATCAGVKNDVPPLPAAAVPAAAPAAMQQQSCRLAANPKLPPLPPLAAPAGPSSTMEMSPGTSRVTRVTTSPWAGASPVVGNSPPTSLEQKRSSTPRPGVLGLSKADSFGFYTSSGDIADLVEGLGSGLFDDERTRSGTLSDAKFQLSPVSLKPLSSFGSAFKGGSALAAYQQGWGGDCRGEGTPCAPGGTQCSKQGSQRQQQQEEEEKIAGEKPLASIEPGQQQNLQDQLLCLLDVGTSPRCSGGSQQQQEVHLLLQQQHQRQQQQSSCGAAASQRDVYDMLDITEAAPGDGFGSQAGDKQLEEHRALQSQEQQQGRKQQQHKQQEQVGNHAQQQQQPPQEQRQGREQGQDKRKRQQQQNGGGVVHEGSRRQSDMKQRKHRKRPCSSRRKSSSG